jgi:hypothetical protein
MTTDCAEPSDSLDPTLQMVAGVSCLLAAAGLRVEISPVGGAVVLQVAFASLALAAKGILGWALGTSPAGHRSNPAVRSPEAAWPTTIMWSKHSGRRVLAIRSAAEFAPGP